ncbi:MAG: SRPBCC family protein [Muribaculaceae bacterium]|nr:SRPBCC family protein [Muribaculaceae bacterium]
MATYKSDDVLLLAPAEAVFAKLSNLENLRSLLEKVPADQIPADKMEMFNSITVTPDSITVPGGPVGALTFRVKEKVDPTLIRLQGEGSPVPLSLSMQITPDSEATSKAKVVIDIEIPAMLKPMVGGHIQKMADQFGQVLKAIPFT